MTKRDTILQELKELGSRLGDVGFQHNPYQVPPGYFDGLAGGIMKRIKALESTDAAEELEILSPLLSSISRKMPHSVPPGYFDELGKKLEQSAPSAGDEIAGQETEELSPLLNSLRGKTTYTVPAGYFENFPATVTNKVSGREAKVISFTQRKWFRYAAAAIVIGFVATLGFIWQGQKDVDPGNKSYTWVKKNLKKVSTDEISEFVELATAETNDVVKLDTKKELSNLLKDVSDKEIQEFLNETQAGVADEEDDIILN
jgi:hypothetical protein